MFSKILIANRGEIAVRIIKTCRRMGIKTVVVYSEADADSMAVEMADETVFIGPPPASESYLVADKIIAAVRATGAEAIHPGFGFLSESAAFARRCAAEKIVFIGPNPHAIEAMGDKIESKKFAVKAGISVVPGHVGEIDDTAHAIRISEDIGYPVMLKASAGGGGKGIRVAWHRKDVEEGFPAVKAEAKSSFGDDRIFIEKFIESPRHVEIQVLGDKHGHVVHLFERECSIQRRNQKVIEEAPSPLLDEATRKAMGDQAVALAMAVQYDSAGTVEFVAGQDRSFFFLEMNTRLQVEHPITEMITGEDLVEWQLRVAAGEPLPLKQTEIITGGHAIEVRICAENPANDFLPETGKMHVFATPTIVADDDVRLDTGVVSGDEISVYYDPMIAKLITWGEDRAEATRRMQDAIAQTDVLGVKTNLAFLQQLVKHPAFLAGKTDTSFIPTHRASLFADESHLPDRALIAASLDLLSREASTNGNDAWDRKIGWWLNRGAHRALEFHTVNDEEIVTVDIETVGTTRHVRIAEREYVVAASTQNGSVVSFTANGHAESALVLAYGNNISILLADTRHTLRLVDPFLFEGESDANAGRLTAMMPGRVVKVMAKVGDSVKKGQALIIMEAMKMEHTIVSPKDGIVERVAFKENDLVPADAVLFAFEE